MQSFRTAAFLRRVLFADAVTCTACGLLLALGAGQLEQLLGLPAELSRYAGLGLLPFAAFLIYLGMRENLSPSAVWLVIILNALWTIDSILLLLSGWVEPSGLGSAFVIFQAVGVAMFAALEYFGLRKSTTATV